MNSNLTDEQIFSDIIIPAIRKDFPLSKIIALKRVRDGFRVGFLRLLNNPNSGIIQTWMLINNEPVLINEN
jgi:hypothetical protein